MKKALIILAYLIVAYIVVSGLVYAFRHPEMTDTQRILHIKDSLLWK